MSDGATLETLIDGVSSSLEGMIRRANVLPQFFQRNVIPRYLEAQKKRFMSENVGEEFIGGKWADLNPAYAEAKLHRFKKYEGQGRKKLIATGKLFKGILAQSADYRQVIGDKSLIISTTTGYAPYVDDVRTVSKFSKSFYQAIGKDLMAYIKKE